MNHDQTTAELRKRIGQTSASLNQCAAQDKAIATGATARFQQVQARMDVVCKTAINRDHRQRCLLTSKFAHYRLLENQPAMTADLVEVARTRCTAMGSFRL
jgi:hypothetical protein